MNIIPIIPIIGISLVLFSWFIIGKDIHNTHVQRIHAEQKLEMSNMRYDLYSLQTKLDQCETLAGKANRGK